MLNLWRADIMPGMFNSSCSSCVQNVWVNLTELGASSPSGAPITVTGLPVNGNTVYFKYSATQSTAPKSVSSQQLASILEAMRATLERLSGIVNSMR